MSPIKFWNTVKAKVELEAFPISPAIPAIKTRHEFPVMVRFTGAAWPHAEATGVDVVTVLDIRNSTPRLRLERIKQAMEVIVDKLSPGDRLSIVLFGTNVHRLTELTYMSGHGRDAAKLIVDQLEARGTGSKEQASAAFSLREGALILRDREDEGSCRRVGCMMFLSAGDCPEFGVGQEQASEYDFPVHTFGLGADHDPKHMKNIADQMSGSYYSLIKQEDTTMAMELFMAALTSPLAARSVKITVRAHEGVAISSIESGGYAHRVSPDELSGEINMDNMYAGEQKNFIVYLTVAADAKEKLVTIGGWYEGCKQLAGRDVSVVRQEATSTAIRGKVAAELVRLRLEKGVSAIVQAEEDPASGDGLQQLWDDIKGSLEGRGAPEVALSGLGKDVAEMKKSGLPYMLSWLSCHKWQRQRATTTSKASLMAWTIPCSRLLIPSLVLVFALLLSTAISWPPNPNTDAELSRDPLWPMLEPPLENALREMGGFRYASPSDTSDEIRRQLLLAVMHASAVPDNKADDEHGLKHQAYKYLQEMLQASEILELEEFPGSDDEHAVQKMKRHIYRATILATILKSKWPMPPPRPAIKCAMRNLMASPVKENAIRFFS